jgi:uncharacterized membrane protein YfhO
MECGEGIEYRNGTFIVNNTSSSVMLYFEGLPNCETYINIKNLHYLERRNGSRIYAKSDNISKTIICYTPYYTWYADQHDFLINLNYATKERNQIEIKFQYKGVYSLDDLQVICQPVDNFNQQLALLKENILENISMEPNKITGTITADKDKLLCFQIPYSKGWTAYIDGKKVEFLQVNTMYCGVFLPAGNHDIILTYMTPYLKQGCILSLIGLCLFIIVILFYEKKRKVNL